MEPELKCRRRQESACEQLPWLLFRFTGIPLPQMRECMGGAQLLRSSNLQNPRLFAGEHITLLKSAVLGKQTIVNSPTWPWCHYYYQHLVCFYALTTPVSIFGYIFFLTITMTLGRQNVISTFQMKRFWGSEWLSDLLRLPGWARREFKLILTACPTPSPCKYLEMELFTKLKKKKNSTNQKWHQT